MKSTKKEPKYDKRDDNLNEPALMRLKKKYASKDFELVVLRISPVGELNDSESFCGVVVYLEDALKSSTYSIGKYESNWDTSQFYLYRGKVTLSN